jgi:hypothetical protein
MIRIYLDNDVSSAITRRDLPNVEMVAVDQLLAWHHARKILLGTSRQSHREMERAPIQHQPKLKAALAGLDIASDDHRLLGFSTLSDQYGGFFAGPLITDIVDEELYARLMATGLKRDDAHHLMYAVHNSFAWFVTMDRNFLSRSSVLASICSSIGFCKPSGLISKLSPSFAS